MKFHAPGLVGSQLAGPSRDLPIAIEPARVDGSGPFPFCPHGHVHDIGGAEVAGMIIDSPVRLERSAEIDVRDGDHGFAAAGFRAAGAGEADSETKTE